MKELYPGNLVYHKKYGQGIVTSITLGTENINFEDYTSSKKVPRVELFTKGDKVLIMKMATSFDSQQYRKNDIRIFLGFSPWGKKNRFVVSHPIDGGHCTIHSYTYVYDIGHVKTRYHKHTTCHTDYYTQCDKRVYEYEADFAKLEARMAAMKHIKQKNNTFAKMYGSNRSDCSKPNRNAEPKGYHMGDLSICEDCGHKYPDLVKEGMMNSLHKMELISKVRELKNAGFSLEDTISIIQGYGDED